MKIFKQILLGLAGLLLLFAAYIQFAPLLLKHLRHRRKLKAPKDEIIASGVSGGFRKKNTIAPLFFETPKNPKKTQGTQGGNNS